MTHVTRRLTAKNRDQLRNPTLGNRVWATFTFSCASRLRQFILMASSVLVVLLSSKKSQKLTFTNAKKILQRYNKSRYGRCSFKAGFLLRKNHNGRKFLLSPFILPFLSLPFSPDSFQFSLSPLPPLLFSSFFFSHIPSPPFPFPLPFPLLLPSPKSSQEAPPGGALLAPQTNMQLELYKSALELHISCTELHVRTNPAVF